MDLEREYYNCADFKVKGGKALTKKTVPYFVAGDLKYPNEKKCQWCNGRQVHQAPLESPVNPPFPGEHSGRPYHNGKEVTATTPVVAGGTTAAKKKVKAVKKST